MPGRTFILERKIQTQKDQIAKRDELIAQYKTGIKMLQNFLANMQNPMGLILDQAERINLEAGFYSDQVKTLVVDLREFKSQYMANRKTPEDNSAEDQN